MFSNCNQVLFPILTANNELTVGSPGEHCRAWTVALNYFGDTQQNIPYPKFKSHTGGLCSYFEVNDLSQQ